MRCHYCDNGVLQITALTPPDEECASGDATQNDVGWIRTLCESCRENYDKIRAKRWEE